MSKKRPTKCFLLFKRIIKLFYKPPIITGKEDDLSNPCVFVGNHSQIYGPLVCETYFPSDNYLMWCASEVRDAKKFHRYAYSDFWVNKSKLARPFYKVLSVILTPFAMFIFKNARTLPVYRDMRIVSTFKITVQELEKGKDIIIFPECKEKFNNIVNDFQKTFVDVGKIYYKRTGKNLKFVPFYVCPKLRRISFGEGIEYNPNFSLEEERERISTYLKNQITALAISLPEHKVVPYLNVSKKEYSTNK